MITTLHLVRHAHTDANEFGSRQVMAGWYDIPLSDAGERQLQSLELRFASQAAEMPVYTSDSIRARCTAAAIAGRNPVKALRALREISCGALEGWPHERVRREHPDLWEQNEVQADEHFCWPGGESYSRFRRRVLRALRGIAKRHPGQSVIIVTHAGVVSQTIGHILGLSPALWSRWRPGNGSVTTVACEDELRLLAFDDRDHLEELTLEGMRQHGE
jgi:2,3-bisphosphoglycerate-dependent phosphoglycerate mutase